MTRRFQLSPIATQAGFAQTIVLPPPLPAAPRQPQGDGCVGVPDPPSTLQLGSSSSAGCPPGQLQYFVINFSNTADYELVETELCADSPPATWPLRRLCDGVVLNVLTS